MLEFFGMLSKNITFMYPIVLIFKKATKQSKNLKVHETNVELSFNEVTCET